LFYLAIFEETDHFSELEPILIWLRMALFITEITNTSLLEAIQAGWHMRDKLRQPD